MLPESEDGQPVVLRLRGRDVIFSYVVTLLVNCGLSYFLFVFSASNYSKTCEYVEYFRFALRRCLFLAHHDPISSSLYLAVFVSWFPVFALVCFFWIKIEKSYSRVRPVDIEFSVMIISICISAFLFYFVIVMDLSFFSRGVKDYIFMFPYFLFYSSFAVLLSAAFAAAAMTSVYRKVRAKLERKNG